MKRIPVTILTGFLGAGKTTLLNRVISESGFEQTAVIVNEFGEVGVDGALVTTGDERAFAMSTGCLCCTVSGDVRLTLLRLLSEAEEGIGPSFDRVVIETTGIADPLPILQTFMVNDYILSRFALNGVVTLVDAVNGDLALDRFEEAQRQVAVADLILITKGEIARDPASQRDLDALRSRLQQTNPNASVMRVEQSTATTVLSRAAFDPSGKPPDVHDWLRFERDEHSHDAYDHHDHDHHHHEHDVNRHGNTASAFCFSASAPVDPISLEDGLTQILREIGPDLLRVKGLIDVVGFPNRPRVLHVVGHVASPPRYLDGWPAGLDSTRLVLIVAGSRREKAAAVLMQVIPGLTPYRAQSDGVFG